MSLSVQDKILELDEECAREQMKVQQQFSAKLRPFYNERQKLLKKIPNFWGKIIRNALHMDSPCECDKEILDVS